MFSWFKANEEYDNEPPEQPLYISRGDTVVTMNQHVDAQDSSTSYSESDSEEEVDVKETRRWIEHIVKVTCDVYEEPHEMIALTYKTFNEQYASQELVLGALEYIRDEREYNHKSPQQGFFKRIFYNSLVPPTEYFRSEPCKALYGVPGVFLVNKKLDFVYGRVIECALLNRDAMLSSNAYEVFKLRKQLIKPCPNDHDQDEKGCPSDWVLYVDVSSTFYAYCSTLLKKQIPCINFGVTTHYVESERLSFYLVLFLCGELLDNVGAMPTQAEVGGSDIPIIASEHYTSINQWKKLPVWFLGLWYAAHPDQ